MHSISHETHAVLNHTKYQLSRTLCSQGPGRFIVMLPRKSSIPPKNKQTVIADVTKDIGIRILPKIMNDLPELLFNKKSFSVESVPSRSSKTKREFTW